MIEFLKNFVYRSELMKRTMKESGILDYGRDIITDWVAARARTAPGDEIKILDIGCGDGCDLLGIRGRLKAGNVSLFGTDSRADQVRSLKDRGVDACLIDIEKDPFPHPSRFFDFVICNQILEHTKEIFWIFSELGRILKPSGHLIVGVPNLAALHNRIALLFGDQPVCMHVVGPHVRGFTKPGLQSFIEAKNLFRVVDFKGSNLYPFPPFIIRVVVSRFPSLGAGLFFLAQRTAKEGSHLDILKIMRFDTNYYRGPAAPRPEINDI